MREWGLREDVVEKDYVLGWVLWAIGADPELGDRWVFKGGTCLKKCYVETYRFSEDLDFTVLPGIEVTEPTVVEALKRVLARATEESGVDFAIREPLIRLRPDGTSMEGRVYYRGPRDSPEAASVKIDLSLTEVVVRPPVLRTISHPYPDTLPGAQTVRCYSFEEVFAEKLRAMGERGRPRDLYDIVNLFWRPDLRPHGTLVRQTLEEKCRTKGVPVPTMALLEAAPSREQLVSEWASMLGHQLQTLPPFEPFWAELPGLFAWLDGAASPAELPEIAGDEDVDSSWTPPTTAWTWNIGVPFEAIRFAASNRLCVELGYHGTTRVIEPYSLRRARSGNLLLHAVRVDSREHRSYSIGQITSVRVTNRSFRPVFRIEFAASGNLSAPPVRRGSSTFSAPRRRPAGIVYIVQCRICGRTFRRSTSSTVLRAHKGQHGYPCRGRYGRFVGQG